MRITRLVAVALVMLPGCVSSSAGLDRVRTAIGPTYARELRTLEESAGTADGRVRELLARPLDAETAVRVALLSNPEVQASLAEIGIARGDLWSASLLPNPQVDVSIYLGDGEVELEGDLLFDLAGMLRTPLSRQAAESALAAEAAESALEILELAYRTRVAFVRYQAARRARDVLQTVVEASRASWEAALILRDAGNITALEASQEEALYQDARLALTDAELRFLEAREQLNARMGLYGPETEWEAQDELPAPPEEEFALDRLEARAVEANVALGVVRDRMRAAGQQLAVAQTTAALPTLRAGVAVRREDQAWTFGPALVVDLPVFGQNQGGLVTQEARFAVLEQQYAARAIQLRSLVRRARNRMVIARERERFLRETLLPLRQRVVSETMEQHNAMNASVFQVLAARRAQLESALEHVEALRQYWTARAALEQLLAGGWVELDEVGPAMVPSSAYESPQFGR